MKYKIEITENKPVYSEQIKSTRMSARDRGIIDEIINNQDEDDSYEDDDDF